MSCPAVMRQVLCKVAVNHRTLLLHRARCLKSCSADNQMTYPSVLHLQTSSLKLRCIALKTGILAGSQFW